MTRRKSYQFGSLLGIPWRSARYVLRPARFLDSALGATLYGRWTLRAWSVNRALSSAGEHRLHTAGVAGSNPAAPTIFLWPPAAAPIAKPAPAPGAPRTSAPAPVHEIVRHREESGHGYLKRRDLSSPPAPFKLTGMMMREVFMRSSAGNKLTATGDGILPFAVSASALVALLEVFAR